MEDISSNMDAQQRETNLIKKKPDLAKLEEQVTDLRNKIEELFKFVSDRHDEIEDVLSQLRISDLTKSTGREIYKVRQVLKTSETECTSNLERLLDMMEELDKITDDLGSNLGVKI